MQAEEQVDSRPWYREPWPWLLMAGPAIVIVAGTFTAYLAVHTDDGLVAEDYYRRGMAINQTLKREARALELHLHASVVLSGAEVRVTLQGDTILPPAVMLWMVHPTRSGGDQQLALRASAPGIYEATLSAIPTGVRRILLQDAAGTWRLDGVLKNSKARLEALQ